MLLNITYLNLCGFSLSLSILLSESARTHRVSIPYNKPTQICRCCTAGQCFSYSNSSSRTRRKIILRSSCRSRNVVCRNRRRCCLRRRRRRRLQRCRSTRCSSTRSTRTANCRTGSPCCSPVSNPTISATAMQCLLN